VTRAVKLSNNSSDRFRARRVHHWRAALALLILCAGCTRGCSEAEFELAQESRLPQWFTLPTGLQRMDVGVSLSDYSFVSDVIQHRRMEPVFYITDDSEVRRKLGVVP
jgi:hypothetical protein